MTKVTFTKEDEVLAAIIRALAGKVAGYHIVAAMTDKHLHAHGYYTFNFSDDQHNRFKRFIENYVPERFQSFVEISSGGN